MNAKIEKKKVDGSLIEEKKKIKKGAFVDKVKEFISAAHVSTNPYEIESASADLTSLPFYHYKFKEKYLADYVIRPLNTTELSKVIKLCREYSIPVTIRSAGTSCFSSATPTKGGAIIDMRRINKIHQIDLEKSTVKCGAGISWLNLIEALSDYGLGPRCYPTSFKTSCVGGFIATPGKSGIGVPKHGPIKGSIISLVLVRPDGEVVEISRDSKGDISFDDVIGTYGIYGAISEVELSVIPLKMSLEIVGFGFSSIKNAIDFYLIIKNDLPNKPFFLSISGKNFEKYSHIEYPEQDWLIWAVFYDDPEKTSESVSGAEGAASKLKGISVKQSYLKEKWRDINDAEVSIGRSCRNLLFQEYWISDDRLLIFYSGYISGIEKFDFRTAIYTISGDKGWSRIKIFGLTSITDTKEFFAIKAFMHNQSEATFERGDRLYTIGVINTFYLLKYQPEEVYQRKILKDKLDPEDLFNSYRITSAKMKYWRISLMFKIAKFLYSLRLESD